MTKTFVVIGRDILGGITWAAAPTIKEAAKLVQKNNNCLTVADVHLYLGKGKITVSRSAKVKFTDAKGKVILIGKRFLISDLINLG